MNFIILFSWIFFFFHGIVNIAKKQVVRLNKNHKFKKNEVFVLLGLSIFLSLGVGYFLGGKYAKKQTYSDSLKKILENYQYIVDTSYQEVDEEKLAESAIAGMVESLDDPYSDFINRTESSFDTDLEGSYQGYGITIQMQEDGTYKIIEVLPSSPAKKAQISAGEILYKIDDFEIKNRSLEEIQTILQEKNTHTFWISNQGEMKEYLLEKEKIELSSVESEVIEGNQKKIGYLSINLFAKNTDEQFKDALESLTTAGIDGLILDLRNNSGGYLTSTKNIMEQMIMKGNVLYQTKTKKETLKYISKGTKNYEKPIVILINERTASASEMITLALKENLEEVTIVGKTSVGKGSIQEIVRLSEKAEYKTTTKEWLSPKGNSINQKGIKPDVEITNQGQEDLQKQKAIDLLT